MTSVLVPVEEDPASIQPQSTWTEPSAGLKWRCKADYEAENFAALAAASKWYAYHLWHLSRRCGEYASATAITGLDSRGTEFILRYLAGWTAPPAMAVLLRHGGQADHSPTLESLHSHAGGFLPLKETHPSNPQEMVRWLYEESGLTWDQLARTLGVSRRSVHAWARGQRVSGTNLERLSNVYSTIRGLDANSAADRRYAFFSPRDNNQPNLFDQLVMHARKAELPQDEQGLARRLGIAAD